MRCHIGDRTSTPRRDGFWTVWDGIRTGRDRFRLAPPSWDGIAADAIVRAVVVLIFPPRELRPSWRPTLPVRGNAGVIDRADALLEALDHEGCDADA